MKYRFSPIKLLRCNRGESCIHVKPFVNKATIGTQTINPTHCTEAIIRGSIKATENFGDVSRPLPPLWTAGFNLWDLSGFIILQVLGPGRPAVGAQSRGSGCCGPRLGISTRDSSQVGSYALWLFVGRMRETQSIGARGRGGPLAGEGFEDLLETQAGLQKSSLGFACCLFFLFTWV